MAYNASTPVSRKIVEGLREFSAALKSGKPLAQQMTCHTVRLNLAPRTYRPTTVKAVRKTLQVSQAIFAEFIGVSVKTVQKWERGEEVPKPIARRFMDEIVREPEHWRRRLAECLAAAK
jgi:putative transcriptional regulator